MRDQPLDCGSVPSFGDTLRPPQEIGQECNVPICYIENRNQGRPFETCEFLPAFQVGSDCRFDIEMIDTWRLAQGKLGG